MTNQEAIVILGELKKCYLGGIVDALDFAIEALKSQEPHVSHKATQKYRAETQKATAQNVEVKQMIEEINRRTRIPFHPDISTSKDDTLQEGQPSSDKRG